MLDNDDYDMFDLLYYIIENKRGDICILDWCYNFVVVVKKLGEYRFFYEI